MLIVCKDENTILDLLLAKGPIIYWGDMTYSHERISVFMLGIKLANLYLFFEVSGLEVEL